MSGRRGLVERWVGAVRFGVVGVGRWMDGKGKRMEYDGWAEGVMQRGWMLELDEDVVPERC